MDAVTVLANHGVKNPIEVEHAARIIGLPVSAAAAMLLMETSGGINEYGHDPVRWPQIRGGMVTHANYLRYRYLRERGYGNQGVGPCQLTSRGLQIAADNRGGCWIPLHNMTEGFHFLFGLFNREHGDWQLAFRDYNGSGPAAELYGERAKHTMDLLHRELTR